MKQLLWINALGLALAGILARGAEDHELAMFPGKGARPRRHGIGHVRERGIGSDIGAAGKDQAQGKAGISKHLVVLVCG